MKKIQPKSLEITQEELDKVAETRKRNEITKVSPEWRLLAEFGVYYGYEAIKAVRNNEISADEFNSLLSGGRKVWAGRMIDLATVSFTALVASKSKKSQSIMNKGLREFVREVRQ